MEQDINIFEASIETIEQILKNNLNDITYQQVSPQLYIIRKLFEKYTERITNEYNCCQESSDSGSSIEQQIFNALYNKETKSKLDEILERLDKYERKEE